MVAIAGLNLLFKSDPTAGTQYRGVYRKDPHRDRFAAKFKIHGTTHHLGYYSTERAAAERVAQEYAAWYGPDWHQRFRTLDARRSTRPWQPVRWFAPRRATPVPGRAYRAIVGGVRRGLAPPGWRAVGWAVEVWEWGRPVVLGDHLGRSGPRADWPHRRRVWVWRTERAARAAALAWQRDGCPRRWGWLAPWALYR